MKAEFFRVIFRYRFLIAIILSGSFGIFDILTLDFYFKYDMVQLYMFKCNGWGVLFLFSFVASAIPGVMGICEDQNSSMLYMTSIRFGSYYYAVCKTVMCALAAFFVSFFGDFLFSLFIYFRSDSFFSEQSMQYYGVLSPLFLAKGYVKTYYVLLMIMQGIRMAFYAIISLGISVFLKNKIAILSLPVVIYYFTINFTYTKER